MSACALPIGVVMPTLNVRASLPRHLEQMRPWLPLVDEVVVVDSYSTDGTFEYLQANLDHPRVRFLQHPPGLYSAWNYGIRHISSRFTYVSTAGDTITADGLRHLADTAQQLRADIVVSRPTFENGQGLPEDHMKWPIHRLLEACRADCPEVIEPWQAFVLGALHAPEGMMGSSASNLYASGLLRAAAFPEDYGHAGDSAWGIQIAFIARMAVTPAVFSRFVVHPNENSTLTYDQQSVLLRRFHDLLLERLELTRKDPSTTTVIQGLLPLLQEVLVEKRKTDVLTLDYYSARRQIQPWFLNPKAWEARARRNTCRKACGRAAGQLARFLEANASDLSADSRSFTGAVTRHLAGRAWALTGQ